MEISGSLECPFCGQTFETNIDTSLPEQRLVLDCEVCCRPLELTIECEPGEILRIDIAAG